MTQTAEQEAGSARLPREEIVATSASGSLRWSFRYNGDVPTIVELNDNSDLDIVAPLLEEIESAPSEVQYEPAKQQSQRGVDR